MSDTTVKKVSSTHSPTGEMGQKYLVAGKSISMRLWSERPRRETTRLSLTSSNEQPDQPKPEQAREYETVGYVIAGKAELHLEGQVVKLEPGDSWVVPKGATHTYKITEPFTAVEATSPPARVDERDEP
ncbi:MAG TPA: cupin domain-containing protein [Xenococcaceae cyanobacterium]|jgi:quercetin dioxygenase-like cupin family protein